VILELKRVNNTLFGLNLSSYNSTLLPVKPKAMNNK